MPLKPSTGRYTMKKITIALLLICFLAAGYGCANKAQQGAGVGSYNFV